MDRTKSQQLKGRTQRKKPAFRRQEISHQQMLKDVWRKPRGHHSKLRMHLKPRGVMPSIGFSAPRAVRGLDPQGRKEICVSTVSHTLAVNPTTEVAVIRSSVGGKKRAEIMKAAAEKNIPVKN